MCLPRLLLLLAKYGNFISQAHFDQLVGSLRSSITRLIGPQVVEAFEAILNIAPEAPELIVLILRNLFTAFPVNPHLSNVRTMTLECYLTKELTEFLIKRNGFERVMESISKSELKLDHENDQIAVILMLQVYLRHRQQLDLDFLAKVFGALKPACEYEYLGLERFISDSWFPVRNLNLENLLRVPFYVFNQAMKDLFHEKMDRAIADLNFKTLSDLFVFCSNNRIFHEPLFDAILGNLGTFAHDHAECLQHMIRVEVPENYMQTFYTNVFAQFELLSLSESDQIQMMSNFLCHFKYISATSREDLVRNSKDLMSAVELIMEQFIFEEDRFGFGVHDKQNEMTVNRLISDNSPILNNVILSESIGFMPLNFVHRAALSEENKFEVHLACLPNQIVTTFKPYYQRHIFYQAFKSSIVSHFQLSGTDQSIIDHEFDYLNKNYSRSLRARSSIRRKVGMVLNGVKCSLSKVFYHSLGKRWCLVHPKEDFFTNISDKNNYYVDGSSFAKMLAGSIMEARPGELVEIVYPDQFNDMVLDYFAEKEVDKNDSTDLDGDAVEEI